MAKTHFTRSDGAQWADSYYRPFEPVGNVFYVGPSGTSSGPGYTPETAYATVPQAMAVCQANNGDVILVLPGTTATITAAAGIALSVAGVTVQGIGTGTNRPTITLGTATTATLAVSAANVTLRNMRLVSGIDSLAMMLDVNEGGFTVEDCDFVTSSGLECLNFINLATTFDDFVIRRCRFLQPTDPAGTDGNADTGAIYLVDSERVLIEDCYFAGQFETAIVHNKTTAAGELWVRNCYGRQTLSGAEVFTLPSGATGGVQLSFFVIPNADDVTEAKTWGTLPDTFFIDVNSCVGNDGAGGQLAVASASAAT